MADLESDIKKIAYKREAMQKEYAGDALYKYSEHEEGVADEQYIQIETDFIWTYHKEIADYYKMICQTRKEIKEVAVYRLLRAYQNYKRRRRSARESEGSEQRQNGVISEIKDSLVENGERENAAPVNVSPGAWGKVSSEVKSNVREVCKWLYRHYNDTGLSIAGGGETHRYFVQKFVVNQPMPIKIVAFYLVEHGLSSLTHVHIMDAYFNYTPNYEKIRANMANSKIRFWESITGSRIHWAKLENAMQEALEASLEIVEMGTYNKETGQKEGGSSQPPAQQETTNTESAPVPNAANPDASVQHAGAEEGMHAAGTEEEMHAAGTEEEMHAVARHGMEEFEVFIQKLNEYARALEDPKSNNDQLDDMENEIRETLSDNQGIINEFNKIMYHERDPERNSTMAEKAQKVKLGSGGSKAFQKSFEFTNKGLEKAHVVDLKSKYGEVSAYIQMGLEDIAVVLSLTALCMQYYSLFSTCVTKTMSECYSEIFGVASSTESVASSVATAVQNGFKAFGATNQINTAAVQCAAGTTMMAAGIGQTVQGGYDIGKQMYRSGKEQDSYEKIQDKERDTAQTKLMERLHTHYDDKKGINYRSGGASMLSGGLKIAAGVMTMSAAGVLIGGILGGIALGIDFVSWMVGYYQKKAARDNVIDEYVRMDELFNKIKIKLKGGATGESARIREKDIEKNKKDIKQQIRYEVAAMEGCASPRNFSNFILKKYAKYLYAQVFFKDGKMAKENMIVQSDREQFRQLAGSESRSARYREFLEAYGIEVIYPRDKEDKPAPSIQAMALAIGNG